MKCLIAVVCLLMMPQLSQAKDKTKNTLRVKADQGDAQAQCALGLKYDMGEGVEQDFTKAAAWYSKAANQGLAYAQCNLGSMYDEGVGVKQCYDTAVQWYKKAADQE